MQQTKFATADKKEVALFVWDEVKEPRLVVQLVHGMCEHSLRYDHFAKWLNERGIIVAMNDQRGHGASANPDSYGYEEGEMWENNVADQISLSEYLVDKYKLPLVLFGHSYGSFLTQRLIEIDHLPLAYVLSGSCYMKNALMAVGAVIAKSMARKNGNMPNVTMANMSFKAYEKTYPGRNSWLNRDQKEVDKYNADPACGYVASRNFYYTFTKGLKTIYTKEAAAKVDLDKPIYIFSGAGDPVGEYGKGVQKLYDFYKNLGVKELSMKLYENGRHEMLNEINKMEVYEDVLEYLQKFMLIIDN